MTHKDFLFYVIDLLQENNIEYWFMCGTLLGAIRDKDFLPEDHCDTDIAIKQEDGWKLRYILNKEHINQKKLQYDYIRRGEITVKDLKYKYKVDIFLMEQEEENFYIYSYRPNPETKKWDYEWRASFPYKLFFPLKTISFLNKKVYIPKEYEKILEIHYGKDWTVPNPNWISNKPFNADKNYEGFYPAGISPTEISLEDKTYDFAYICINLLRKEATKNCIISLKKHCPTAKIYIADQDKPSGEMLKFYEINNVEYYYVPFDCGLSYARNFLIDKIKEPYIMWGDNDFLFDEKNNILEAIELLKSQLDIGVVGGGVLKNRNLLHYERKLIYDKEQGILIYIPLELTNPQEYYFQTNPYYYCDLTFNYAIAKKEVFDNKKIRWNEVVKVRYEHSDFFLKLKLFSQLKTVYYPHMQVHHVHSETPQYQTLRCRREDAINFAKYWNLNMNFTVTLKDREIYLESAKLAEPAPKIIPEPPKPILPILNVFIKNELDKPALLDMTESIKYLNTHNLDYWLIKDSCYKSTIKNTFIMEKLYLGVPNKETQDKILSLNLQCPIEITIEFNRKIKNFALNDVIVKVPFPVIKYLEQYTHKSGNQLQNE